jgi:hypothetical protein
MYTRQMEYGGDIPLKCSPLLCAALCGHVEVARLLLERGADKEAKSMVRAATARCVAAQRGRHASGARLARLQPCLRAATPPPHAAAACRLR